MSLNAGWEECIGRPISGKPIKSRKIVWFRLTNQNFVFGQLPTHVITQSNPSFYLKLQCYWPEPPKKKFEICTWIQGQCRQRDTWLTQWISRPTVLLWTNPLGVRPIGKWFKKKRRYIEFVTTSVTFYLIFPKFSTKINIFDDLDKVTMNILNLMCSHGPGRWVDAQRCPELDLKFSRSNLISKSALTVLLQTHELNQHTRC